MNVCIYNTEGVNDASVLSQGSATCSQHHRAFIMLLGRVNVGHESNSKTNTS